MRSFGFLVNFMKITHFTAPIFLSAPIGVKKWLCNQLFIAHLPSLRIVVTCTWVSIRPWRWEHGRETSAKPRSSVPLDNSFSPLGTVFFSKEGIEGIIEDKSKLLHQTNLSIKTCSPTDLLPGPLVLHTCLLREFLRFSYLVWNVGIAYLV